MKPKTVSLILDFALARLFVMCAAAFVLSAFLIGCVSLPEPVSSDSFSGTVLDGLPGNPIEGVIVYGEFTSQVVAWDNSGQGGAQHILCKEYAISDAHGHFTFPSLFGVAGVSAYSFGETRSVGGPYFTLLGIGYSGAGVAGGNKNNLFFVSRCDPYPSLLKFSSYLEGEKALSFRKEDYPRLLQFLEKWYEVRSQHLQPSAKDTNLYQKYKAIFENRN